MTYLAAGEMQTVLDVIRVLNEDSFVDSEHLALAFDGDVRPRVVHSESH